MKDAAVSDKRLLSKLRFSKIIFLYHVEARYIDTVAAVKAISETFTEK